MPENVFVLGLDQLNLETLRRAAGLHGCRFHPLSKVERLKRYHEIPMEQLLEEARDELVAFDGSINAIVGYWDFPVSSMVPILCEQFGLRSASLESVVKCEHKYWSRLEQQKVIAEHPRFALADLDHVRNPPDGLDYPLWVKPVKSAGSMHAFHVGDATEYQRAVASVRESSDLMGKPFDFVLGQLDLPGEIAEVGGQAALVEEALGGRQITLEGYRRAGELHFYGAVDSVTYPESPSFLRYQYPSMAPSSVLDRMVTVATRVVEQVHLDSVPFNVEFFWDAEQDRFSLLEVNPRPSQSHAKLFEYVDGAANHQCMIQLALGRDPDMPHRQGPYRLATKWFLRRFVDGVVRRSPTEADVERVEAEIPGTSVSVLAHDGDRLSDLPGQDSYSYVLAHVYVGAADQTELIAKYERCVERLPFWFDDPAPGDTS